MLENIPYYLEKEVRRRTAETLNEANYDHLAQTAQNRETTPSNKSKLNYLHKNEGAWWTRVWQKTYNWFRSANT